jgi:hypothetical protein
LKVECENDDEEVIQIDGLQMNSDMKDIFKALRA